MTELLPCPFCGSKPAVNFGRNADEEWAYVTCNCGVRTRNYHGDTDKEVSRKAADAWNTRAERTCKPLGTIRYDYEGGYAGFEYETELSCGHKWRDAYGDYPNYCPSCGAKVVE